ncbi:MAG: protein-methionine-sulfoxide reductase catalytic subunit MsrP, partial [Geminicoccales bacterium]
MLIKRKRGFEVPESAATPEPVWRDRRRILKALGVGGAILAAPLVLRMRSSGHGAPEPGPEVAADPSAGLYPVPRNPRYTLERPLTDPSYVTGYNNFYEFGSQKRIADAAQALRIRPWQVAIDGLVEKPMTIGIDDLLRRMPLEERLYRHRCVEAWSITVPWSGFALKALVDLARPLSSAKYLEMTTFEDPEMAPGQRQGWYPWPYVEGLTIAEAINELAFIATGLYGKPILKQNGAPLRLAVPWKYGFKS